MISIWLCPTHEDELYLQKIINKLSENYNSPIFLPHCTLLGGIKLNEFDLEKSLIFETQNLFLNKDFGVIITNGFLKSLCICLLKAWK